MAIETERKYLVNNERFHNFLSSESKDEMLVSQKLIKQGYLQNEVLWHVGVEFLGKSSYLLLTNIVENEVFVFRLEGSDAEQLLKHDSSNVYKEKGAKKAEISLLHWALRIRVFEDGTGELCLKERVSGQTRGEVEVAVSESTSSHLYEMSDMRISKVRYNIKKDGYTWEVDTFNDENSGLITAELETEDADYSLLSFIEHEVTDDIRYFNESLSKQPFTKW